MLSRAALVTMVTASVAVTADRVEAGEEPVEDDDEPCRCFGAGDKLDVARVAVAFDRGCGL